MDAHKAIRGRLEHPRQVFVLSGPSGVGKNALAAELVRQGHAVRAVTATTRRPRPGEAHGRDYYFVTEGEFHQWVDEGRLIEHARYVGHGYGTPAGSVNRAARSGLPVILTIDVEGGTQIKAQWPEVTLIFILPPSHEALRDRLKARGRDSARDVEQRLQRALDECKWAERYDYRIVNDQLDQAVERIAAIMHERITGNHNKSRERGSL